MKTHKHTLTQSEKIIFICFSFCLLLFLIFLVYYHITDMSFYITNGSCGMKYLFHLYCPGCGGTRAIDMLLHGRILKSLMYHPIIVYLALFFLSYYIPTFLQFVGLYKRKINYMTYIYILIGMLIVIVVHFIVRNVLLTCFGIDYIGECISYWS